ncbi:MAG: protein jag [Lachnospiraceae bacterium]|nr:protein jag [Lachnospiraceae bacterium]
MSAKEFSGRSVEDALTQATVELGVTSDQLSYVVVEKGSSGLFGIGSKEAVIRVRLKSEEPEAEEEVKEEAPVSEPVEVKEDVFEEKTPKEHKKLEDPETAKKAVEEFLKDVFDAMELEVTITTDYDEDDNTINVDLAGPEMGIIIGKRGSTLDSLQYLANLALNRRVDEYTRVKIDTEDYRRRRKETLENLAKNMAYKVKRNKRPVSLESMNPYERRVIHYALQNDEYVTTHSEGEEPYRHVVITLKK